MAGNAYGRVIGIVGGTLGAIGALLSMGDHHPFWELAIFFLCVWIVYGIIVFGEDEPVARPRSRFAGSPACGRAPGLPQLS